MNAVDGRGERPPAAAGTWVPTIERTYSSRLPISEVMQATIVAKGDRCGGCAVSGAKGYGAGEV